MTTQTSEHEAQERPAYAVLSSTDGTSSTVVYRPTGETIAMYDGPLHRIQADASADTLNSSKEKLR